jgi:tetratricopeptide (TPR) repeat protein
MPLTAANRGAAFDVESLFDDELEPERSAISRPDEPTDPKAKLDGASEVGSSAAPRAARSKGLQSWPLLAAAGVLGLVAVSLSFRACGSSDQVASSKEPAPHILKPSAEPPSPAPMQPTASAEPGQAAATATAEPAKPAEEAAKPASTEAAAKPATAEAKSDTAVASKNDDLAGGKTLTAAQAKPLPDSLRGGVVPYRANNDPQIDYKAKGREYFSAGKYKEAAEAYQHATQKTPSDAGAFAGLGASYLAAGQPDKAIPAYQRALQLKPDVSGFQAALGRAYLQKGDRGRAASAYRKALELDPQNAAAKTGLQNAQ